ncbi:hypothetical protein BO71DRAFT_96474 [Aspergillus ellipticus CBS 707.79]|uniref:Uncharacterized protein n=1 Tax=Aspergillus ellipticus CBS 707.79 TaxID=1448320 RepID=A0A319CYS2_9EURO|nr:hypothetical protein BO71DRAFT_96474 [Aspergillus ellipticus CBS 707.79]
MSPSSAVTAAAAAAFSSASLLRPSSPVRDRGRGEDGLFSDRLREPVPSYTKVVFFFFYGHTYEVCSLLGRGAVTVAGAVINSHSKFSSPGPSWY